MKEKENFINFRIGVDELVHFRCQATNNKFTAEKDIFKVGNHYFFFVFNRNERTPTFSLRQITEDEFNIRKNEFLKKRPHKFSEEWYDSRNKYFLNKYSATTWQRDVPIADCIFFKSDSPLKDIYEATTAQIEQQKVQDENYNKKKSYDHARKCGALGVKLGIAYENVMRIGPDRAKLIEFKKSCERAVKKLESMPIEQVRSYMVDLFGKDKGREKRREVLNNLEIQYFDVDVNLLKFDEMQKLMERRLQDYVSESIKKACDSAINCDYEKRCQILQDLSTGSRPVKREALRLLGVNTAAIDFNRYPIFEIRRVLAQTLGRELEC